MNDDDDLSRTMRISILPEDQLDQITCGARITKRVPRPVTDRAEDNIRFDELFQNVYDAALICSLTGRVLDFNIRALDFFNYTQENFLALAITDIVNGMDQGLLQTVLDNLQNNRFTLIEAYCNRADASLFPAEIAVNLLNNPEPRLCFFIRDITQRYQAEQEIRDKTRQIEEYAGRMETLAEERAQQLVHADRMVRLGVMSAGVAHEVNNPATFIAANTETIKKFWEASIEPLLRDAVAAPDDQAARQRRFVLDEFPGTIEGIRSGVDRIKHIVKGLKTFAYQGKATKALTNVNNCIDQALDIFGAANKKFVTVKKQTTDGLPLIMGDAHQLVQVLVNLFGNAADAMEPMGQGTLHIIAANHGNLLKLTVRDTGPGIPPDKLTCMWEPFFTTKPAGKGTGLGLSISYGIIKAMDGTISVENHPAGGACFIIELPVTQPPAGSPR